MKYHHSNHHYIHEILPVNTVKIPHEISSLNLSYNQLSVVPHHFTIKQIPIQVVTSNE